MSLRVAQPREVPLRKRSFDAARERVRSAFAEQSPAAAALGRLLMEANTSHTSAIPPATARWMAAVLDDIVPDWRQQAPAAPPPRDAEAITTGRYALDTSGCGDMALRLHLDGVTVIERDDNVANDRVYCVVQAEDESGTEVLETNVTVPLDAGSFSRFDNSVFFGAEAPRDPGRQLRVRYDCWEYDNAEDYQRFREATEAIRRLGKLVGGSVYAKAQTIAEIIDLVIDIAAIFDGDDHLFQAEETLTRQAVWGWIVDSERVLVRGGTNNTSDWSWQLHLRSDGCAGMLAVPPPQTQCDASTCDGCCVGGICQPGDDEQACGSNGATCVSCGTGERCVAGGCAFDERAQYDVVLLQAEISDRCWDAFCGAPDPYVWLSAGGDRERSSLVRDTRLPVWSETLLTGVTARDLMRGLGIEVFDDDLRLDDEIATCIATFTPDELQRAGDVGIACGEAAVYVELISR